jgi:hypothetical protein
MEEKHPQSLLLGQVVSLITSLQMPPGIWPHPDAKGLGNVTKEEENVDS